MSLIIGASVFIMAMMAMIPIGYGAGVLLGIYRRNQTDHPGMACTEVGQVIGSFPQLNAPQVAEIDYSVTPHWAAWRKPSVLAQATVTAEVS